MVEWIKHHAYMAGGVVLGLFVLFLLMRRNTSAAAPAPAAYGQSDDLSAMQLQAGTQLQGYAYAAQAQVAGINASTNQTEINQAAETQRAFYARQVELESIQAGRAVSSEQIAAALRLGLVQTGALLALNDRQAIVDERTPGLLTYGLSTANAAAAVQQSTNQAVIQQAVTAIPAALPSVFQPPTYTNPTAAYVVNGGGPGLDIHGVDTQPCNQGTVGGQYACAVQNQRAIEMSYDAHSGSYLGGGIFAHTADAWRVYGDPSMSFEEAQRLGRI